MVLEAYQAVDCRICLLVNAPTLLPSVLKRNIDQRFVALLASGGED
jgi:hypothetical protein